ncbi:MAG TPA: AAA family ATPase [Kofleriaceae bacterium]|nr:AAA family ATPase [Kofleriaceae bacterium]
MKLIRLELEQFTAFEQVGFDFAPGVNVLIGENGTGKSHVLKLIYCLSESIRRYRTGEGQDQSLRKPKLVEVVADTLVAVFQPDELGHLVRRGADRHTAKIRATWGSIADPITLFVEISKSGITCHVSQNSAPPSETAVPSLERSIFIPTREVLSIFPGFISSYVRRESAFDRTFYDLCLALDAKPLRGPHDEVRGRLLEPIEDALGGEIVNDRGRFYLKLPEGDLEAPLVAEGIRKLGMLDYLIRNGSLTENGFLLWDEPEASLNPRLTRLTGHIALGLAHSGVQTWIATHDYLLTSELTLEAERLAASYTAFFSLSRPATPPATPPATLVERGDKLADLQHNSILKALSELHDREQAAFLEPAP